MITPALIGIGISTLQRGQMTTKSPTWYSSPTFSSSSFTRHPSAKIPGPFLDLSYVPSSDFESPCPVSPSQKHCEQIPKKFVHVVSTWRCIVLDPRAVPNVLERLHRTHELGKSLPSATK